MRETKINRKIYWLIAGVTVVIMAVCLWMMGRVPICDCGYIKLWHGVVVSSENSQHLFDWYTFTHVIHGLGFFLLLSLFRSKLSVWQRFVLAVFLECAWEVLENTDAVINRYRAATISLDYYGDSIINSIGDVIAMIAGFWFAYKKPLLWSAGLFIILELFLAFIIKDNLSLNIIMLIHPIEAIKHWQSAL